MLLLLNGNLESGKNYPQLWVLVTLNVNWFTRLVRLSLRSADRPSVFAPQPCAHTFQSVGQVDSEHIVSAQSDHARERRREQMRRASVCVYVCACVRGASLGVVV